MGAIETPRTCLYLMAAFSRHSDAIDWARKRAESEWGPVVLTSPLFEFDRFTQYYQKTMGVGLKKVLWAFSQLADPAILADRKLETNRWEEEYVSASSSEEARPLNLDPGYLTEAKLVLATTKDRDHRIYLRKGIFAEVTLAYRNGEWGKNRWTYPDYQSPEYHEFLIGCRRYLRDAYRT